MELYQILLLFGIVCLVLTKLIPYTGKLFARGFIIEIKEYLKTQEKNFINKFKG